MNFKRYRDYAIVLFALVVPFWFLRASIRDPQEASGPDKLIIRIATPVQYAAATLARGISSVWGDYIYLVDVKEDNAKLVSQNARLGERVRLLEAAEVENRELKRSLDLKQRLSGDVVSAQVIAKDTNEFFRVTRVTLDRDLRGMAANLPVLSPDGVVGTTMKAAGDTVDVRLIADAGTGVDVIVQRTGARGIVSGLGDEARYRVKVQYMERTDEVEVGDLLVTSGVGRRFPKGVPVGTVTEIVKRDFGIYQQVVAEPAVDFSRLEVVLIEVTPPTSLGTGETPAAGAKN